MRIEIDYDFDAKGNVIGTHFIETSVLPGNTSLQPSVSAVPIDKIQCVKNIHVGTIPIAGTSWDVISKHPLYPGQTRMQVFLSEIVRLNDVAARAALGV